MATVLEEFQALAPFASSEEERSWLTAAQQFIERTNGVHTYLKLVGD